MNFPGIGGKSLETEQMVKELSKSSKPPGLKIIESVGTASAQEAESKKEKLELRDEKINIEKSVMTEEIETKDTEEAKSPADAKDISELNDEELSEIYQEIEKSVKHEINLFGKALRKSIMEELQKKLAILESRFLKKVLKDVLAPNSHDN
jgi:hypothetical protein